MRNEHILSFFVSVPATLLTFLYGPDRTLLYALLILMVFDYVTGLFASILDGTGLCSRVGLKGLLKKLAVLCIIAVTNLIDQIVGTNVAMLGAIYFYAGIELISITENCGRIGIPMPKSVKEAIRVLKERSDSDADAEVESQVHDHEVSSDSSKQKAQRD